jgi:MOSC domain-containing protein YiiM
MIQRGTGALVETREAIRGIIRAVCVSDRTGVRKHEVDAAEVRVGHGLVGDAHAGSGRQVSLLAQESIDRMRDRLPALVPGDFAENLTTGGMALATLPVGTRLAAGPEVVLEITQIGKTCHKGCEIMRQVGTCVMPTEGVFARVVRGGTVRRGDPVDIVG